MRSLYVNQLASAWMEDSTAETIRASFEKKVDSFFRGELEHATEMLSDLWEIVNKDGDVQAPLNTSPAVSPFQSCFVTRCRVTPVPHEQTTQVASPAHWGAVKLALIDSIDKGVFFDRKYWVRHSNSGNTLKPIYFSSIVMGDKTVQLNNCALQLVNELTRALRVVSGNPSRRSGCSHKLLRGGRQRRKRLRR